MDEIERQLRGYADAAEEQVPASPEVPVRRRSWRPPLAVAAVVALVGGSLALFLTARGEVTDVHTAPADDLSRVPPIRIECPIPPREPKPGDLTMMLPWVSSAREETKSSTFDGLHVVTIAPDTDRSVEVRVAAEPPSSQLVDPPPESSPVAVSICDPFAYGDGTPSTVDASRSADADGTRSLKLPLSDRWVITLTAGSEVTSRITYEDLVAVVSGMAWQHRPPARTDEERARAPERCEGEPDVAIEMGSFTLTALPDGFEPQLPVEEHELGPGPPEANAGGPTATLSLVHPDGRTIEVSSFGAQSPRSYIASSLGDGSSGNVNVRRCIPVQDGWERYDSLAVVGTNGGRTMLAAQEWEYEGYLVIGSPGVAQETLVEVAESLRHGTP